MQAEVLTDTVEDNHVIVDGVTDDGQYRSDEGLVDVKVERQDSREEGEEADNDDGSVCQLNHAAETPGPATETEGDVSEDYEQREENREYGGSLDVARDGCTHLV